MKYSPVKKQILIKLPRYELVEYIFKKLNKSVERKDIFEFYYRNIDDEKQIICHENDYASLTTDQEKDIAIVVLNNKRLKFIRQKTIYVLTRNYRGIYHLSFLNDLYYNGRFKITQSWLNQIKTIDALFPFTHFDSFSTNRTSDVVLEIQTNDVLRIIYDDLNYNPNLFFKTENLKLQKYFDSYVGIINRNQVITLSTEEQTKLKQLMSKDVDDIKKLLDSDHIKNVLDSSKTNNLKQKQFYLYDNSNIIKPTLLTTLNKKVNLYGKMELQITDVGKLNKLIKTEDSLKFQVSRSIFKEELDFEIQNIIKEEKIKTADNKIYNITIVMIPQITKKYTLVDSIKIIAFSSTTEKLNPVSILIENNDLINHFSTNKNYKFRLTVNSIIKFRH